MPDINVPYNQAKRITGITVNKVGTVFQMSCHYALYKDGIIVTKLRDEYRCLRSRPWAEVPADVQAALVKIDNYMQTAINEDAGL